MIFGLSLNPLALLSIRMGCGEGLRMMRGWKRRFGLLEMLDGVCVHQKKVSSNMRLIWPDSAEKTQECPNLGGMEEGGGQPQTHTGDRQGVCSNFCVGTAIARAKIVR